MTKGKIFSTLIEEMGLSVRAYTCLKRAGINTVDDLFNLLDKGLTEVSKVRHLGIVCTEEILIKANELGYDSARFIEREIKAQKMTDYYGQPGQELFEKLVQKRTLQADRVEYYLKKSSEEDWPMHSRLHY